MITVKDAEGLIFQAVTPTSPETVNIGDIGHHILVEDIIADRDLPPYNRVAMDGVAINFSSYQKGQHRWFIEGMQKAGESQKSMLNKLGCMEAMTGAVLPQQCDTIIPYEHLVIEDNIATLRKNHKVEDKQNVHHQGSDRKKGSILLEKNTYLDAAKLSVLASVGKHQVKIAKLQSIAFVSTGDELVEIDQVPAPHQIRRSNNYGMIQMLNQNQRQHCHSYHLNDEPQKLFEKLETILSEHDMLILSGGVSMGKFDFIPSILEDLGVQKIFHKIMQRPGKPMWFGINSQQKMVFALPGNPVSSLVCFRRYVLPALMKQAQTKPLSPSLFARTRQEIKVKNTDFTNFIPVKIASFAGANIEVDPVSMNGSGDFVGLGQSDGFLELAPKETPYDDNSILPLWLWRSF